MMKKTVAVLALLALIASPAFARHCPKDMAEIDQALASNPQVSAQTLAEVKALRAKGEELHKAGNHPQSEAVLGQAKALLGLI